MKSIIDSHAVERFKEIIFPVAVAELPAVSVAALVSALFVGALSFAQVVLMVLRSAALLPLAGSLQLAASGAVSRTTRPWLRRITAWSAALILYKPMAATVYATAFLIFGHSRNSSSGELPDPIAIFQGIALLLLAIVALPAMVRFFSFIVDSVGGDGLGTSTGSDLITDVAQTTSQARTAFRGTGGGSGGGGGDTTTTTTAFAGAGSDGGGGGADAFAGIKTVTTTTSAGSGGSAASAGAAGAAAAAAGVALTVIALAKQVEEAARETAVKHMGLDEKWDW
jgi:hypothetical protein